MRKLYFIISLTLILLSALATKADDSIPATDLQELVVKSERSWVENGVFNFLPTKKEKQLSNTPGSLIKMMNIPLLKADGEAIRTLADEPVSIFINGEPANDIDISTFWPSDVKKVEYMQSPSDPTFRGAKNVVNFVMAKYEVGGVTRVNVRQDVPMTNVYYDLASKLAYKKMTYGISVNSFGWLYKDSDSEGEAIYKDIFYDGVKYKEIRDKETTQSDSEFWKTTVAANAKYTGERFSATHTIGFIWSHTPGSNWSSSSQWSENLFGSEYSDGFNKSDSYSPSIRGDYFAVLSDRFTINGGWSYVHSVNSSLANSKYGETPTVDNDFSEKVNSVPVRLNFTYSPNSKWTLLLNFNPKSQWLESSYTGSVETKSRQFREDIKTSLTAYWQPSNKLRVYLEPGLFYNYYKVDDIVNEYVTPTCDFNVGWYPNRKLNIRGDLTFYQNSISARASNPVTYKKDELTWVSGNPGLKPESDWIAGVRIYYAPTDWLQMSSSFSYIVIENSLYEYIQPAPEEMGGVIKTQRNCGRSEDYRIAPSVSVSLFDRNLSLSFWPKFSHKRTKDGYYHSLTCFQSIGDIRYTIGNFNIEAKYMGRRKYLPDESGNSMVIQPDNFSLGVAYGWRNLYAYCGVDDLFHKKYKSYSYTYSDVLTTEVTSWSTGRKLKINLTYTFGYGKKVDPNINISVPLSSDSSIL